MTTNLGAYDISSLLAARNQTMKEIGEEAVSRALQADLDAHNMLVLDMVRDLCEFSTDAVRVWGGNSKSNMFEVDEYGAAPSQKNIPGYNVGFPMRLFQHPVNFTKKFLLTAPVSEIAQAQVNAEIAHKRQIELEVQKAVFKSSNFTFTDRLVDNVSLSVKRFLNKDSQPIPNGAAGQAFTASTHTHYQSTGTAAWADFNNLISNVAEHGHSAGIKLCINRANKDAYVALWNTTNTRYTPVMPAQLINPMMVSSAGVGVPSIPLELGTIDNKLVGLLNDGTEVWIKSWIPENYAFVYASRDVRKPLVYRQRNVTSLQGLRLAAEFDEHPLLTRFYEAEFGVGVWERSNGAVLYTGNDTWADGA